LLQLSHVTRQQAKIGGLCLSVFALTDPVINLQTDVNTDDQDDKFENRRKPVLLVNPLCDSI
jgi:hypothetical protein